MRIHPYGMHLYPGAAQLRRPPAQPTSFASRELQSLGTRCVAWYAEPLGRPLMGANMAKCKASIGWMKDAHLDTTHLEIIQHLLDFCLSLDACSSVHSAPILELPVECLNRPEAVSASIIPNQNY